MKNNKQNSNYQGHKFDQLKPNSIIETLSHSTESLPDVAAADLVYYRDLDSECRNCSLLSGLSNSHYVLQNKSFSNT